MRQVLRILSSTALFASAFALSGCGAQSSNSFFGGKVSVAYNQIPTYSEIGYESLVIYVNEPGTYHFAFSETPGKHGRTGFGASAAPKDFDVTLQQPDSFVFAQPRLPDYLRITITHNGVTETHDVS